jgi:hypothetical protein
MPESTIEPDCRSTGPPDPAPNEQLFILEIHRAESGFSPLKSIVSASYLYQNPAPPTECNFAFPPMFRLRF